jgi:catechol 2,3-dioxygenase-like lactoylglutathione lyase family enzyme
MLRKSAPIAFVATAKPDEARAFYERTLGLDFVADEPFALIFDLGSIMLRIQKVDTLTPPPQTSLGWEVADIDAAVTMLAERGVAFEHFDFLPQDERGIWTTPSGARIAWFKDPDGNTLSLTQM